MFSSIMQDSCLSILLDRRGKSLFVFLLPTFARKTNADCLEEKKEIHKGNKE